ncbi:uncharacterized protein LOC129593560 [Paramacrobiotus metropolitanus]|uniref:uncharacterized protein LOC129593560 n=1 Tax=Paramacrobiotus metropolitanus TaxID=2943436 RepID=UPI0024462254|nr:uncharacterized protein LOC129593560 [Paramacrobiotus metropolitanus]
MTFTRACGILYVLFVGVASNPAEKVAHGEEKLSAVDHSAMAASVKSYIGCAELLWEHFLKSLAMQPNGTVHMTDNSAHPEKTPVTTTADPHHVTAAVNAKTVASAAGHSTVSMANTNLTTFDFKTSNCSDKTDTWTLDTKLFNNVTTSHNLTAASLQDHLNDAFAKFDQSFMSSFNVTSKGIQKARNFTLQWVMQNGKGGGLSHMEMDLNHKIANGSAAHNDAAAASRH